MATIGVSGHLDLLRNHLVNALLHPVAVDPTSPDDGQAWVNTADGRLKIQIGGEAKSIAALTDIVDSGISAAMWDAQSVVVATADDTPTAVTISDGAFVGRPSGGNVGEVTVAEAKSLLSIPAGTLATEAYADAQVATETARTDALWDAQSVVVAETDNTPTAVPIADGAFVGRPTGGNVGQVSAAQAKTILGLPAGSIATEAYADSAANAAVAAVVDSAPGILDTLAEIATALGNDENFAATITGLITTERERIDGLRTVRRVVHGDTIALDAGGPIEIDTTTALADRTIDGITAQWADVTLPDPLYDGQSVGPITTKGDNYARLLGSLEAADGTIHTDGIGLGQLPIWWLTGRITGPTKVWVVSGSEHEPQTVNAVIDGDARAVTSGAVYSVVETERARIDADIAALATERARIDANVADIATNATDIATNAADITTERARIDADIAALVVERARIDANATAIANHIAADFPTVAAMLASTDARAEGDILTISKLSFSYVVAASGATNHHLTTASGAKLYVQHTSTGEFNVLAFGALPGVAGGGDAIQLALDASSSTYGILESFSAVHIGDYPAPVYIPAGKFLCSQTLVKNPKSRIRGSGNATVLELESTATDTVLIELGSAPFNVNFHSLAKISDMVIQTTKTGDTAGIKVGSAITNLNYGEISYLYIIGFRRGIDTFPAYTQTIHIHHIYTSGPCEQAIRLSGNVNVIDHIERGSPFVTPPANGLPWILITPNDGNGGVAEGQDIGGVNTPGMNVVRSITAQQVHPIENTIIRFERCNLVTLEMGWWEPTDFLRHIDFDRCRMPRLDRINLNDHQTRTGRIRVADRTHLTVKTLLVSVAGSVWTDMFDVDSNSHVHVEELDDFGANDGTFVNNAKFSVDRIVRRSAVDTPVVGLSPKVRISSDFPQGNMFTNPSFEAGFFGWNINTGGIFTTTTVPALAGLGNAIKLTVASDNAGSFRIRQRLTVTAEMVGNPLTLTMVGKQVGGLAASFQPFASGAGLGTLQSHGRIIPDRGPQVTTITVTPTAVGTLDLGATIVAPKAGAEYILDEMSAYWGYTSSPLGAFGITRHTVTTNGIIATGPITMAGNGAPEGVVECPVGSIYMRADGGPASALYVKGSGTGSAGWVSSKGPDIASRTTNTAPLLGGALNIYPTGATVLITGLVDNDVFTCLVSPGESVIVGGTTHTAPGGNTYKERMHFAKISGTVERIT